MNRVQEYSLSHSQRIFHFANASTFTRCPELILMCFVTDERHSGESGRPRMIFKPMGLQDLQISVNGIPSHLNEWCRGMDLTNIESPHVDHFYRTLIEFFRPHAENSISRLRYHTEFFLIPIETAIVPRTLYPPDPSGTVNLVQSINLDLQLNFAENLTENMQMLLISFDKVILNIGTQGDITEL